MPENENEWRGSDESGGTNGEKGTKQSGYRVAVTVAENHRNVPGKTISMDGPLSVKG